MTAGTSAALLALAIGSGLDLASVVQGLLSRPLIVSALAGGVLGDLEGGLRIGAVLELFALDVVPVGASRYPDFGAATVAAVLYAAGTPWQETLGPAVGLGLVLAIVGGGSIPVARRWNARVVAKFAERLAAGDARAVDQVHLRCLLHDLIRSVGVAIGFLAIGVGARELALYPPADVGPWLVAVALGGGLWAAVHGAVDAAGSGARGRWLAGGLAVGLLAALA
ncbi:MAG: PTS sugar transporter subunit IIC [Gemmatimonadales bacterium]